MSVNADPLTLGMAGHVDHGKTTLVAALTGVDTARLPEEKARGLTIVLGYAPLMLPSGRQMSLVDVPGHERFVRTMVAGASGIDLFLMVVAADDGVMPQTFEHVEVLRALGVQEGVVAITKADIADPERAAGEAAELLPNCPVVVCSARTGTGLAELISTLGWVAGRQPSRASASGGVRLHIDRVFTITGRGTVVTGTLWSGTIELGEPLELLPGRLPTRVRGLEVHDSPVERVLAGQRVAVNLIGTKAHDVERGDVLATPRTLRETMIMDCALALRGARHGTRVHIHHGTRAVPGRLCALGEDLWQVRVERSLVALAGDRLVVRRLAPPDTIGGGVVLDAHARRHGRRPDILTRLRQLRTDGTDSPSPGAASAHDAPADNGVPPSVGAPIELRGPVATRRSEPDDTSCAYGELELERHLREAGPGLQSESQLSEYSAALRALRKRGRVVRVSGHLYAHADVVAEMSERILKLVERDGSVTLAGVRDALGISRKSAQAFLEHLNTTRVIRRLPDDRHVLARRRADTAETAG